MSEGNRKRRRQKAWDSGLVPRYCAAKKKDGTSCGLAPIRGGVVCHKHGGSAPQVRRKAGERLLMAGDTAIAYLVRVLEDQSMEPALRVKVALEIASRTGFVAGMKVEHSGEVGLSFTDRLTIVEVLNEWMPRRAPDGATTGPRTLAVHASKWSQNAPIERVTVLCRQRGSEQYTTQEDTMSDTATAAPATKAPRTRKAAGATKATAPAATPKPAAQKRTRAAKATPAVPAALAADLASGTTRLFRTRANGTTRRIQYLAADSHPRKLAEQIVGMREAGKTIKEICTELHLSPASVRRAITGVMLARDVEAGTATEATLAAQGLRLVRKAS